MSELGNETQIFTVPDGSVLQPSVDRIVIREGNFNVLTLPTGISNVDPTNVINITTTVGVPNGLSAPVGSLAMNSLTDTPYVQTSAGWTAFQIGGLQTLAQTLVAGNTTGGTNIVVSAGDLIQGVDAVAGGLLNLRAGDSSGVGTGGGSLTLSAGTPGIGGSGGNIAITSANGNGLGQGGTIQLTTGLGNVGGDLTLQAGIGNVTGGLVTITSGGGITGGGNATFQAGDGFGGGGVGGNVILQAGNGTATGGNINITPGVGVTDGTVEIVGGVNLPSTEPPTTTKLMKVTGVTSLPVTAPTGGQLAYDESNGTLVYYDAVNLLWKQTSVPSFEEYTVNGGANRNPINSFITSIVQTAGALNATGTLANGTYNGQIKNIVMVSYVVPYVLAATNVIDANGLPVTTITFNNAGASVSLIWSTSNVRWFILNSGADFA